MIKRTLLSNSPDYRKSQLMTFVILLFFAYGCTKPVSYDLEVDGLHYMDKRPVRISIQGGKIATIKPLKKFPAGSQPLIIAPGLIDNQVNGYVGYSFVDTGGELTAEGIRELTAAFWKAGNTTFMPTLTTNEHAIFLKNLRLLNEAMKDPRTRGSIAGIHMEGPYISPVDGYRGAHPLMHVRPPVWDEFMELYEASGKNILQVTLAPEPEGAMEFISRCKELGIFVGLGHHNGTADQISEAVERGAVISTHLGNGMANMIHRWHNPLWPQLANDKLYAGLICDGFHLTPEQIRVFYKTKGADRIIVTSDMSSLGGLTPGYYLNSIGDTLELKAEGVVMYPAQNVLSGSASPQSGMIGHIMKVTGCDLATAIKMTSTNAARLYRLKDRGELKPGLRADMILFTLENGQMKIKKTLVEGKMVYEATE